MRLRILSSLLLLAVCFDVAASDLYTAINRLRAGEGNCAVAEKLAPLKPQAALERVARDLSRGDKLQHANLMNPAFTEMGVAFAVGPRSEMGVYWTQVFGTPR